MKPMKLPWQGRKVPCSMLDIIRGCNCVCKACYNLRPPQIKPLEEIAKELEGIRKLRDAEIISISGGEPLMHPQIAEVIRLIHDVGVVPTLLTNGILWTDEVAEKTAKAGLGIVFFHIQAGQKRPERSEPLTEESAAELLREKCAIAKRHGIEAARILTVNVHQPDEIDTVLRAFRADFDCSLVWMTLEREMQTIGNGHEDKAEGNGVADISEFLTSRGWYPFAGLGGYHQPKVLRWMAYHGFARVNAQGRETAFTSVCPSLLEWSIFTVARCLNLKIPGRMRPSRLGMIVRLVLNALLGGPVRNLGFVLGAIVRGQRIVARDLVVEALPELLPDGRIEHCEPCVDATAINGKLVAPCMVDLELMGRHDA